MPCNTVVMLFFQSHRVLFRGKHEKPLPPSLMGFRKKLQALHCKAGYLVGMKRIRKWVTILFPVTEAGSKANDP